jgi:hypothetical protein
MAQQLMLRLPKGEDLQETLNSLCAEHKVTRGMVKCIGALEKATLAYYHQEGGEYESFEIGEPVEILAGVGNVSLKDGEPFVHMHLTVGLKNGDAKGGHLMPGCPIFACEAVILEIPGAPLEREFDEPTGLPLWK